jgi:hypothetical protein
MKNELKSIWEEVVVACFKVLSRDMSGENEKSHTENMSR